MVIDAREIEHGATFEADLCIVGAGVAGLTLARELIGSRVRVWLLESGGREHDARTQALSAGENVGFPYYPLDTAAARRVGGSSVLWHVPIGDDRVGARVRPLDPIDFERRPWVPHSGWPFPKACLDRYYARADEILGVAPHCYDPKCWAQLASAEALPLGDGVESIVYKFTPRELFAREYPAQVEAAANVTVCVHATVVRIETNEPGTRVSCVRVASPGGRTFQVRARAFVLAAGGIETPRLLLASNERQCEGLGNGRDLVGRFFMEHLHFWSGMLVVDDPGVLQRTRLYNKVLRVDGVAVVGKLALSTDVLRRERLLNQNIQLFPRVRLDPFKYRKLAAAPLRSAGALLRSRDLAQAAQHAGAALAGWRDVAAATTRRIRQKVGLLRGRPVIIFANMAEQAPNPESRLALSAERDEMGLPKPRLDWKISGDDIRSIRKTQAIVAPACERVGLGRFFPELLDDVPPKTTHGGYHHMGTTRMHRDPKQGVVDGDCRVHGIDNLYIAGPSVFPTGGYANPIATIVALSVRLAEHLLHGALNGVQSFL